MLMQFYHLRMDLSFDRTQKFNPTYGLFKILLINKYNHEWFTQIRTAGGLWSRNEREKLLLLAC